MKNTFFLLFIVLFSANLSAQKEQLTWYTDLNEASKISAKTNKPLMLFFTGSDWCGWCVRLQKEVFLTDDFKKWAADNVILVDVDFPKDKSKQSVALQNQNNLLARQYEVRGYPTVWFVAAAGSAGNYQYSKLGQSGYMAGGPSVWTSNANGFLGK
jgi:protein disulfide-isomerase